MRESFNRCCMKSLIMLIGIYFQIYISCDLVNSQKLEVLGQDVNYILMTSITQILRYCGHKTHKTHLYQRSVIGRIMNYYSKLFNLIYNLVVDIIVIVKYFNWSE